MAQPPTFVTELTWRGLLHGSTPGVYTLLQQPGQRAYLGVDPTGPSLHVGHLATLLKLVHFQRAGHQPILLVGGATGMVGDPSGRSAERNLLTLEQVLHNAGCLKGQMARFLDFGGPNAAILVNNYDWFGAFGLLDFLREVGKHFTVNYMMSKDSVQSRLDKGISFTEFSYQLLQAYDFLELYRRFGCRLQVGGSDQWGNITSGIELIRRAEGAEAHGITFPLITRQDGAKFGKTATGDAVWLDPALTSPYRFYQFWMNQPDAEVPNMLKHFSLRPQAEIEELIAQTAASPEGRAGQRSLAEELAVLVHGQAELDKIKQASGILFGMGTLADLVALGPGTLLEMARDIPSARLPRSVLAGGAKVIRLFVDTKLLPSMSEARRQLQAGGLRVNKVQLSDAELPLSDAMLLHGRYILLQKGKRDYVLVSLED